MLKLVIVPAVVLFLAACGSSEDSDTSSSTTSHFLLIGSQKTFLKKTTADSGTLSEGSERCDIPSGTRLSVQSAPEQQGVHYLVNTTTMLPDCGFSRGYVYTGHVSKSSASSGISASANVKAFLDTIAFAEGTNDSYNIIFSFARFQSYAAHPRRLMCSGGYCSDAAGRYQIKSTTWDDVRKVIGVSDFSPASQDRAAIQLIKWRGGLDDVERIASQSDFSNALYTVRLEWASLPHSPYGQPTKTVGGLWEKFKAFRAKY
ncbi:MAG: hypothetical protein RJB13_831 [Pseudomonadota bacterium]